MKHPLILLVFLLFAPSGLSYIPKNKNRNPTKIEPRKFNQKNNLKFMNLEGLEDPNAFTLDQLQFEKENKNQTIMNFAMRLGGWLMGQVSEKIQGWDMNQANILAYVNPENFTGVICSIKKNLNLVEFTRFLNNQRTKFLGTDGNLAFGQEDHPTDVVLVFNYNVTANWGYNLTEKWRVSLSRNEKINRNVYYIYKIEKTDGCKEIMRDSGDMIIVDTKVLSLLPRFMAMHFYRVLTGTHQVLYRWVMMLDKYNFQGTVCTTKRNYTVEGFLTYMEMWIRQWKFAKDLIQDEQKNFKLIVSDPERYIFYYTLPGRMRFDTLKYKRQDWAMKGMIKYNQHGDGLWKITNLELLCNVESGAQVDILIMYAQKCYNEIKEGLNAIIRYPVLYDDAFDFFFKYFHKDMEYKTKITICEEDVGRNYTYRIWKHYNMWNGKKAVLKMDEIDWNNIKYSPEHFLLELNVHTETEALTLVSEQFIHWKFQFELNPRLSVFELNQLDISCPLDKYGNKLDFGKYDT